MKHEKTPWKFWKENEGKCNISSGDFRVAITANETNARRIVAAVNACEGIETDWLEDAGNDIWRKLEERFDKALSEISRLLHQNAEFVFLLRQADKLDRDGYTLTSSWFHEVRNALTKYEIPTSQDAGQH